MGNIYSHAIRKKEDLQKIEGAGHGVMVNQLG